MYVMIVACKVYMNPSLFIFSINEHIYITTLFIRHLDRIHTIYTYNSLIYDIRQLVMVAERSKVCTVFTHSEAGIGFESHSGHGCLVFVYVRFSVFVYR
jgi:hypothetical protein